MFQALNLPASNRFLLFRHRLPPPVWPLNLLLRSGANGVPNRREQDPKLGSIVRIECPPDARCEFLIIETSWNGEIQSGEAHGCDFLIRVG